jgi:nucleoside-diphosphate-sugar epimerase
MRILVLGITGMLGSAVFKALCEARAISSVGQPAW